MSKYLNYLRSRKQKLLSESVNRISFTILYKFFTLKGSYLFLRLYNYKANKLI